MAEELYESILNASPDEIAVIDAGGIIRWVNEGLRSSPETGQSLKL